MILPLAIVAGGFAIAASIYLGAKHMSAATDRLAASAVALAASVDALVARAATIPAPPPDESSIIAAADTLDTLKAKVDAALPSSTP